MDFNKRCDSNELFFENLLEDLTEFTQMRPDTSMLFRRYVPSSSLAEGSCGTSYQAMRVCAQYMLDGNWQACIQLARRWLAQGTAAADLRCQHEWHSVLAVSYQLSSQQLVISAVIKS